MNLFRLRTYFLRGHREWLLLPIFLINSVSIWYVLLLDELPILQPYFASFILFAFIFIGSYFPLAILIGYWDIKGKNTAFKMDWKVLSEESPLFCKLWDELNEIKHIILYLADDIS